MPATRTDCTANSTLVAFTPRQVLLGSHIMKHSSDKNASSNGTAQLKLEQKVLLHQSIAHYLQRCGFSKTLKKFLSEAQIEKDNSEVSPVDLEEIYLKYLETCKNSKANIHNQKEQVVGKHSEEDGESNLIADMENATKRKKKKGDKGDIGDVAHQFGIDENFKGSKKFEEVTHDSEPESKVSSKEKDADDKCKEKKKKKSKLASESLANNLEDSQLESQPMAMEVKVKDVVTADANAVNGVETEKILKDKKKKKHKPSCDKNANELQNADLNKTVSKEDNSKTSKDDVTDMEKKDSKKRRRPTSEENDVQFVDRKVDEEPKRRKIGDLNESKGAERSAKTNKHLGNTEEKSSVQKSDKKQQKGSVEQMAAKAFQRVKADAVMYADERLQDNSYWAKDGAENGYGAKAEEVLGQVRGRDFRHEKTKKKRGSYRGGQIDLQSHSIKFNYSDEE